MASSKPLIVAATGHRLHLLPGYRGDGPASGKLREKLLEVAMEALESWSPDLTISGMATGWDMAIAMAAMLTNRPYHCYLPFAGQEKLWGQTDQEAYRMVLEEAAEVKTISHGPSKRAYLLRDIAMVDAAGRMLALYNGDPLTGTGYTVRYAEGWLVPVSNFWDDFIS